MSKAIEKLVLFLPHSRFDSRTICNHSEGSIPLKNPTPVRRDEHHVAKFGNLILIMKVLLFHALAGM